MSHVRLILGAHMHAHPEKSWPSGIPLQQLILIPNLWYVRNMILNCTITNFLG